MFSLTIQFKNQIQFTLSCREAKLAFQGITYLKDYPMKLLNLLKVSESFGAHPVEMVSNRTCSRFLIQAQYATTAAKLCYRAFRSWHHLTCSSYLRHFANHSGLNLVLESFLQVGPLNVLGINHRNLADYFLFHSTTESRDRTHKDHLYQGKTETGKANHSTMVEQNLY